MNLTTPNPVTNAVVHRGAGRRAAPARRGWPSRPRCCAPALGEVSSDLLSSARVRPARLLEAGFTFSYPELAGALAAELNAAGSAA